MKKTSKLLSNTLYSVGIVFCIVASISLLVLSYHLITWTFSEHPEIKSSDYDSSYSSYKSYDCSSQSAYVQKLNQANNRYDAEKITYESSKNKYLTSSNIDVKVTSFSAWADSYQELVTSFNEIVNDYNGDSAYFENCVGSTISNNIELKRSYINQEETILDNENAKLIPQAKAAGYTYS